MRTPWCIEGRWEGALRDAEQDLRISCPKCKRDSLAALELTAEAVRNFGDSTQQVLLEIGLAAQDIDLEEVAPGITAQLPTAIAGLLAPGMWNSIHTTSVRPYSVLKQDSARHSWHT